MKTIQNLDKLGFFLRHEDEKEQKRTHVDNANKVKHSDTKTRMQNTWG